MKTSMMNEKRIYNGICYVLLFLLAIIFLFPLYWFVLNSLKSYEQLFQFPPKFWVCSSDLSTTTHNR